MAQDKDDTNLMVLQITSEGIFKFLMPLGEGEEEAPSMATVW